jgi:hypothetical protein
MDFSYIVLAIFVLAPWVLWLIGAVVAGQIVSNLARKPAPPPASKMTENEKVACAMRAVEEFRMAEAMRAANAQR